MGVQFEPLAQAATEPVFESTDVDGVSVHVGLPLTVDVVFEPASVIFVVNGLLVVLETVDEPNFTCVPSVPLDLSFAIVYPSPEPRHWLPLPVSPIRIVPSV